MTLGVENIPPVVKKVNKSRMLSPKRDIEMSTFPGALTGQPVKSGVVYAIHSVPGGRQVKVRVVLNVYVNNFGRYAVVSQEKAISRDCGFINLKHCSVETLDSQSANSPNNRDSSTNALYSFQIIARKTEGQTMTFYVTSRSGVELWVQTLRGTESDRFKGFPFARTETHEEKRKSSPCRPPVSQLGALRVAAPPLSRKAQSLLPALEEE